MQKTVSGPIGEGRIFDVFSENTRALFVSASEQATARMLLRSRLAFFRVLILWRHLSLDGS
jgi:hypothetical protein